MNHCALHSPHTEKALKSMHGKRGIRGNKIPNSGLRPERKKRKRGNEVARKEREVELKTG